jgi:probable F420-dependent oxidoreductase
MHLGVALPNNQGVRDPGDLVALEHDAEALGFESLWVSDHLFHAGYVGERLGDRPYHEPLTVLAAVAAVTERALLGTSVLVLPWHHPVRLAKTLATLDGLARGRLIVGVGVGVTEDEYAAVGVPFALRGRIADEMLDAMHALWTEDVPEFAGEHIAFSGLRFSPRPEQRPGPPIWVGGHSPAALRRVVQRGDGWHPLGLSPDALARALPELRAQLVRAGRPSELPVAVRLVLEFGPTRGARPPEQRRSCRGTPEAITETLRAYADAGATHAILDPSSADVTGVRESLARFREEVVPALS